MKKLHYLYGLVSLMLCAAPLHSMDQNEAPPIKGRRQGHYNTQALGLVSFVNAHEPENTQPTTTQELRKKAAEESARKQIAAEQAQALADQKTRASQQQIAMPRPVHAHINIAGRRTKYREQKAATLSVSQDMRSQVAGRNAGKKTYVERDSNAQSTEKYTINLVVLTSDVMKKLMKSTHPNQRKELVTLLNSLLDKNLNRPLNPRGTTALMLAASQVCHERHMVVLEELLAQGASPHAKTNHGKTARSYMPQQFALAFDALIKKQEEARTAQTAPATHAPASAAPTARNNPSSLCIVM